MACSKLFSGELPELSTIIIQNLRNNFNTLYSLSLVNRFWCRLAISLLWEDPFSIKYEKNFISHFLDTYFLFLDDNDKNKIKSFNPANLKKPLFNYPSLIKILDFCRFKLHVTGWLDSFTGPSELHNQPSDLTSPQIKSHFYDFPLIHSQFEELPGQIVSDEALTKCFCNSLLKIFIKNNASLNNL